MTNHHDTQRTIHTQIRGQKLLAFIATYANVYIPGMQIVLPDPISIISLTGWGTYQFIYLLVV
ncbi:hypothetical protein [Photorhabdus stackebrandtii]|uniref:Uncharacterized protein n=1 Tax=Photorhabdus stackebrandtii TaxID=1123042 RepID=A0A7X5QQQ8_9GAMM|nr:hypothetical protein [Photorhabdus stackebrandtii]NHB98812.1 hypothetical protein [Photorhabdus stackebrandtii]